MNNIIPEDFQIYSFFDNLNLAKDKLIYMKSFLDKFDNLNLSYKDREKLEEEVIHSIFGESEKKDYFESDENQIKEILDVIKKTLLDLNKFKTEKTYIFILPTFDPFVEENLGGVTGHCFVNNFIFLFLNPKENWQNKLRETLTHEFAHSVSPHYLVKEPTLGNCLISEGLAEHFRETILGGEIASYSKAISEEKINKYLEELKNKLNSTDENLYFDVFFGSDKFPKWAGYSIGYYLVAKYLENKKEVDWNILLRKNPEEILDEILV
jgi:uncharacterized protein YjaZ